MKYHSKDISSRDEILETETVDGPSLNLKSGQFGSESARPGFEGKNGVQGREEKVQGR